MTIYWSSSAEGFFDSRISAQLPLDVVEISSAYREALIAGLQSRKVIVAGPDGYPVLQDTPPPNPDESSTIERAWRDNELARIKWLRERHRDELEMNLDSTISAELFVELLAYIQTLREWPQSRDFPMVMNRPRAPSWINDIVK